MHKKRKRLILLNIISYQIIDDIAIMLTAVSLVYLCIQLYATFLILLLILKAV